MSDAGQVVGKGQRRRSLSCSPEVLCWYPQAGMLADLGFSHCFNNNTAGMARPVSCANCNQLILAVQGGPGARLSGRRSPARLVMSATGTR